MIFRVGGPRFRGVEAVFRAGGANFQVGGAIFRVGGAPFQVGGARFFRVGGLPFQVGRRARGGRSLILQTFSPAALAAGNGQWAVGSGQWSELSSGSGQWAVGNGKESERRPKAEWAAESGTWAAGFPLGRDGPWRSLSPVSFGVSPGSVLRYISPKIR